MARCVCVQGGVDEDVALLMPSLLSLLTHPAGPMRAAACRGLHTIQSVLRGASASASVCDAVHQFVFQIVANVHPPSSAYLRALSLTH
jgi:hypothetical protein